jgi:hypothetical protein
MKVKKAQKKIKKSLKVLRKTYDFQAKLDDMISKDVTSSEMTGAEMLQEAERQAEKHKEVSLEANATKEEMLKLLKTAFKEIDVLKERTRELEKFVLAYSAANDIKGDPSSVKEVTKKMKGRNK